jgi:hypothetical protein
MQANLNLWKAEQKNKDIYQRMERIHSDWNLIVILAKASIQ